MIVTTILTTEVDSWNRYWLICYWFAKSEVCIFVCKKKMKNSLAKDKGLKTKNGDLFHIYTKLNMENERKMILTEVHEVQRSLNTTTSKQINVSTWSIWMLRIPITKVQNNAASGIHSCLPVSKIYLYKNICTKIKRVLNLCNC